jgi:hypothetical protein
MVLGGERYSYNQIIIHAHSHADALRAEDAATTFFGPQILGHGRGFDISKDGEQTTLDWHHYLCAFDPTSGIDMLRDEAVLYLNYQD